MTAPVLGQFERDKRFTNDARGAIERGLYNVLAAGGKWISITSRENGDGCDWLQRNAHIDAILMWEDMRVLTVEEKIVRRKYEKFFVETVSNVEWAERSNGSEGKGWLYTCHADLLIYAFKLPGGELECWIMQLKRLRGWLTQGILAGYPKHRVLNETPNGHGYASIGALVPIADAVRSIAVERYVVGK